MNDIETLKAWIQWRKEKDLSESDAGFVKAIEDTVSQVNNWKAKHAAMEARVKALSTTLGDFIAIAGCTNGCDKNDMSCATNRARLRLEQHGWKG